jgi:hypothetical protein
MTDELRDQIPDRPNGRPHLSECLLFVAADLYCTCDDNSPDWTSS